MPYFSKLASRSPRAFSLAFFMFTAFSISSACSKNKTPAIPLGKNAATLAITSEPMGAVVVLDGKAMGNTPLTFKTRAGQHNFVVRKSGYFTKSEKLFVGARRQIQKNITLVASH